MTFRYRCKKRLKSRDGKHCDTLVILPKKVEDYVRKPKCPSCGNLITYHDKGSKLYDRKNTCKCDGYHFPHRKGSKWCIHFKGELTDEDMQERYYSMPSSV